MVVHRTMSSLSLTDLYEKVSSSVVAFSLRRKKARELRLNLSKPPLLGTDFIVESTGLIVTNAHVVNEIRKYVQASKGNEASDAVVAVCGRPRAQENEYQVYQMISLGIRWYDSLNAFSASGPWFGQGVPDLGFVQVNCPGTPRIVFCRGGVLP